MNPILSQLPLPVRWLVGLSIAVASAGFIPYMSIPHELYWGIWLAFIPMMVLLANPNPAESWKAWFFSGAFWLPVVYGVVMEAGIFLWIADTIDRFEDAVPYSAALAILGLFSIVFGAPYIIFWWLYPWIRRLAGGWSVLAVGALIAVIEYFAFWIILFPYAHGNVLFRVPTTFMMVSVTGIWGTSVLAYSANAAIAEVIIARMERRPLPLAWVGIVAGVWGMINLWGVWRFNAMEAELQDAPTLRVLQIQDDIDMLERVNLGRQGPPTTWDYWYNASTSVQPGEVDLIVWSEGASGYPLNFTKGESKRRSDELQALADRLHTDILVGAVAFEWIQNPDGSRRRMNLNSVYHYTPNAPKQRYDKLIPLPFGEYLPLANVFPWLRDIFQGPGNFKAGEVPVVFEGIDTKYATPICYEGILPHVCRRFPDADVIVNGTLDTWFGDTDAPYQHAMLSIARAHELGRPLIRSAYTGVSLVAEPHGVVRHQTEPYVEVSRVVTVRKGEFQTVYRTLAQFGLQDWLPWISFLGLAILWIRRRLFQ